MTASRTPPPLRVSAGGVVVDPVGRVLLVRQQGGTWSFPKGGVEPGETLEQAARREIHEETGIDALLLVTSLGSFRRLRMGPGGVEVPGEWKEIHLFHFRAPAVEPRPRDPHNPEACWLSREAVVERLSHPRDQEFFRHVIPGLQDAS